MICPYCGSDNTTVYDTRQYPDYRWRRYKCRNCEERFTTKEAVSKKEKKNEQGEEKQQEAKSEEDPVFQSGQGQSLS